MRKGLLTIAALYMALCLFAGCSADINPAELQSAVSEAKDQRPSEENEANTLPYQDAGLNHEEAESEEAERSMHMKVGNTEVSVDWEDNASVEALQALCLDGPLTVQMSMYGGFEQVGPIGQSLPRNDTPTTTQAGDIVLYSGNQIVVFYGSNSWSYTRLGHIRDKSAQEMADLLGGGDVTITIGIEQ